MVKLESALVSRRTTSHENSSVAVEPSDVEMRTKYQSAPSVRQNSGTTYRNPYVQPIAAATKLAIMGSPDDPT